MVQPFIKKGNTFSVNTHNIMGSGLGTHAKFKQRRLADGGGRRSCVDFFTNFRPFETFFYAVVRTGSIDGLFFAEVFKT